MKKFLLLSLALCAALSPSILYAQKNTAAQKIVPAKPVLKTDVDSVSYMFGATLYEQGLSMYLQQLGIVTDTANVTSPVRLDSIMKANEKNRSEFLRGIQESMDAPETKNAYFSGLAIGGQISKQMAPNLVEQLFGDSKIKLNSAAFVSAMSTAMLGGKFEIENLSEIFNERMAEAQAQGQAKQEESQKAKYADQIERGELFMAENKTKDGVVTLPDGLQYKIITEGTGAKPTAADRVKVHYHGTLIDGTVFDSSIDRGEPTTFGVGQVIKGWTEALQLMPVGSKWILYIPYDLAYGARDAGKIKPFSNLIFEIELLSIEE